MPSSDGGGDGTTREAAGDAFLPPPAEAGAVGPACGDPNILCEDFETDPPAWPVKSTYRTNGDADRAAVDRPNALPGNHVLRSTTGGVGSGDRVDAFQVRDLAGKGPVFAVRAWVHREATNDEPDAYIWMLTARHSDNAGYSYYLHSPYIENDDWYIVSNTDTQPYAEFGPRKKTPLDAWTCVELDVLLAPGEAGLAKLFIDGALTATEQRATLDQAKVEDVPTPPQLFLGIIHPGETAEETIDYDDVMVGSFAETTLANQPRLGNCR